MLRFLSALLLILVAVPASAQSGQISAPDLAKGMQGMVGQKFGGLITITGVSSDNNTLVITFDGPSGWREALSAEDFTAAFLTGFCKDSNDFFANGLTLRIDGTEEGASDIRRGPIVDRCP